MRFSFIPKISQYLIGTLLTSILTLFFMPLLAGAQSEENRMLNVAHEVEEGLLTVSVETMKPVGYRYTVYDLADPRRVVVDFPSMVSDDIPPLPVGLSPVTEVRMSKLSLSSGEMTRLEIFLAEESEYTVSLKDTLFSVKFASTAEPLTGVGSDEVAVDVMADSKTIADPNRESLGVSKMKPETTERPEGGIGASRYLIDIGVSGTAAELKLDGELPKYKSYTLKSPARLVIDIFDVKTTFKVKEFVAGFGFKKIRVGHHKEKTRIVFDADGSLPDYRIEETASSLVVSWGAETNQEIPQTATESSTVIESVSVEKVDFVSDEKYSMISVALSGPYEVFEPSEEGNHIRFGIKNAKIDRSLRRTIDTSAFPTSILRITPYTALRGERQDVLIDVELKGKSLFEIIKEESLYLVKIENGAYAEEAPAPLEVKEVLAPTAAEPEAVHSEQASVTGASMDQAETIAISETPTTLPPMEGTVASEGLYSGEKITLIFDQADVRQIFQLIGEVSGQNVILGDGVSGPISLRLIDVPWDQALDLIMDIKGLDMLRKGNVIRILPKDQVRSMRQAELKAVKEEESLEPLVTEVVAVSYTSLGNVSGPVAELLTDRGKVTTDDRNKQLIITDIPSVIEKAKNLVGILDTPEKQVMIEARIVEAKTNFTRQLGVSWGLSYTADPGSVGPWDASKAAVAGGGSFVISPTVGTAGIGSSITFGALGVTSTVLDLKISAAEASGDSKVISKPRVTTLNGETASISQGTKIPYQSVGDSGTKTEFVDATLQLNVTPIINPDDSVILEISASNNTPTTVAGASAPAIDKKEAKTKVLVKDGETTVIGGIFVENESESETGIPILRHIPILGNLFKSKAKDESRNELLIFITPRILN